MKRLRRFYHYMDWGLFPNMFDFAVARVKAAWRLSAVDLNDS